ncbi:hypothetical protein CK203_051298 [Vitis vinifera]|uniref:Uncharacterized protein n=1 Tax=Vitis vinifera TaxID=29760 RepID=A0A438H4C6_VITVI|nr:hypothetical protein CK203_051298 [Vitis vinifera]
MPFPLNTQTPCFFCFSLISILLIVSHHGYITATAADITSTIIGAIIDSNSRKGKEEMTAMKIAVDKFNIIPRIISSLLSPGTSPANSTGRL